MFAEQIGRAKNAGTGRKPSAALDAHRSGRGVYELVLERGLMSQDYTRVTTDRMSLPKFCPGQNPWLTPQQQHPAPDALNVQEPPAPTVERCGNCKSETFRCTG